MKLTPNMNFHFKITVLFVLLLSLTSCQKKQEIIKIMYADTLIQIENYRNKGMELWTDDQKLAISYLSDSVSKLIQDTYISDYKFNLVNDSILNTLHLQKPMFLQVGGRTCAPCRAELPALNAIVKKYTNDISFILLSQYDTKSTLLKVLDEYHQDINLIPYSEEENENNKQSDPAVFSGFKHLVGAIPTNYLIDVDRKIIKMTGGATIPGSFVNKDGIKVTVTKEEAFQKNYKKLEEEIKLLLKE